MVVLDGGGVIFVVIFLDMFLMWMEFQCSSYIYFHYYGLKQYVKSGAKIP